MNPIRIARSWLSYRRTLNELGGLSNQTLSDNVIFHFGGEELIF
ncbi:DUF1127 domain-containing protein, partial [Rhizobium ruizarguesonis]